MEMSASPPDPTSPSAIAEASFSTARRGFHQDEVRSLLRDVATELRRSQERIRQLEAELDEARVAAPVAPPELDDETATRLLGEETARVLRTARESASAIKIRAEERAAEILREATEEAVRLRGAAENDAARLREQAASEAETEVTHAKEQGREMVNEARAYRERVLAELAKRREAARQQIDQLVHGRDRLLQVFERARLVAVDVVSELEPLVEPEEYVDLSPTTGPVPMMTSSAALPTRVSDEPDAVEPEIVEPEIVEHETVEPEIVEPETVEPDAIKDEAVAASPGDVQGLFARLRAETADSIGDPPETESPAAAELSSDESSSSDPAPEERADETVEVTAGGTIEEAVDEDVEETVFDHRDAALVPLIVASARKLKRALADEQNEVLGALRAKNSTLDLDVLVDLDAHVSRYADAIANELGEAYAHGASSIGGNGADGVADEPGLEPVQELIRTGLLEPLRERLHRAVAEASGDSDEAVRTVRAAYREWKNQHIDEQLDDVLRLAFCAGFVDALDAGTAVRWITDPSRPACPDCEDNSLAGPVAAGESFPTGHRLAPMHPGCRCLLTIAEQ